MIPTYKACEIKRMCMVIDLDGFKILSEIINEEIDFYNLDELITITEATMIFLNRSLWLSFTRY